MSGLTAFISKNKDANLQSKIENIINQQIYRGSNSIAIESFDKIGIGLTYKRTLEEDPIDATIFKYENYKLVCDARLDNRQELIELLNLSQNIADGEIILASFVKYGSNCVDYLLGDYAVIILNIKTSEIFAFRDHMGLKPLYIRKNDFGIILSSDFKSLLNPGEGFEKLSISQIRIDQVLDFLNTGDTVSDKIVFDEIERLPAASSLTINENLEIKIEQYWRPQIAKEGKFKDKSPEALKKIFDEAVKCRLRSLKPVCTLISGGLDSSSITVSAKKLLGNSTLSTFSIVFDEHPEINERPFIESVTKNEGYNANFLPLDNYGPLTGLDKLVDKTGRNIFAPGQKMVSLLYEYIKTKDFDVVLDGNGGDEIVSHGSRRLNELAMAQKWLLVWKNLKTSATLFKKSRFETFLLLFVKYCNFKGTYSIRKWLSKSIFNKRTEQNKDQYLSEKFQEKIKNLEYSPTIIEEPETETEYHEYILNTKFTQQSIEFHEFFAAIHGLEIRLPFYDKRMVEYCLSIPPEMKFDKGYTRLIMRKAMEGELSKKIQWRRDKLDFSKHIKDGLKANNYEELDNIILQNNDNIGEYVNLSLLQEIYIKFKHDDTSVSTLDFMFMWRSAALSLWLRQLN